MSRILYLSHVDSRWIKQRPQLLAESLAARADEAVLFVYARAWDRRNLSSERFIGRAVPYIGVPQAVRGRMFWLDDIIQIVYGVVAALWRPDVVMIGHPRLSSLAKTVAKLTRARVVYDTMDRIEYLPGVTVTDIEREAELVQRVDVVAASSFPLLQDVRSRRDPSAPSVLLRNALSDPYLWRWPIEVDNAMAKGTRILGYWGTISHWIDWPVVLHFLETNQDWQFHLWGPVDGAMVEHDRIVHRGIVSRMQLRDDAHICDVLVMPFVRSELIDAVDPVKGYEYAATGRPFVMSKSLATEHFDAVSERYEAGDDEQFADAIRRAIASVGPVERSARLQFAAENTWLMRASELLESLNS